MKLSCDVEEVLQRLMRDRNLSRDEAICAFTIHGLVTLGYIPKGNVGVLGTEDGTACCRAIDSANTSDHVLIGNH